MANAKSYKDLYDDSSNGNESQNTKDRELIEQYVDKIAKLINNNQENQRKAAQIVHNLINSSSKKGKS